MCVYDFFFLETYIILNVKFFLNIIFTLYKFIPRLFYLNEI